MVKSPQELINELIELGLNQTSIAQKLEISQTTVSRIFSGDQKDTKSSVYKKMISLVNSMAKPEVEP